MTIDSKKMFSEMKPWRLFFVVALPGMISMFAMSIYTILEGIFIGHKLGEAAFAAVNIAFPVIMINFSIADLIGVGSSAPISIALGRKDEKSANNIFSSSVLLIFLTSFVMGVIMYFAATPLARFMGADASLLDISVKYIRTYAVLSPITTIFFAMDNYLRICGYVRMSMVVNIFFNAITLVFLLLFLFVFEMDVSGSALASCIAFSLCSFICLVPFLRKRTLLKFTRPHISWRIIKQIALCGSPVFFSNIAGRVTSIVMNITLMTLGVRYLGLGGGTTAVAAYSVLMYANEMGQPLLYGICDSLSPAIGFNFGANDLDRVKKIAKCGYIGSLAVSLVTVSLMVFLARPIALLFVDAADATLLMLATEALRLFGFAYIFKWFYLATQIFLSAIEKPIHATLMSTSVALVFPIITLGALWNLGLNGIWLNTLGTSLLAAVLGLFLLLHVYRSVKKKNSL